MRIPTFLLFLGFFLSLQLNADSRKKSSCVGQVAAKFIRDFERSTMGGCFVHNRCQLSVYNFLVKNWNSIKRYPGSRVLIIRPNANAPLINHDANLTRNNFNIRWQHHVILQFRGEIFDFSYKDNAELVDEEVYFSSFYQEPENINISEMSPEEFVSFMESDSTMEEALATLPPGQSVDHYLGR